MYQPMKQLAGDTLIMDKHFNQICSIIDNYIIITQLKSKDVRSNVLYCKYLKSTSSVIVSQFYHY